MEYTGQVGWHIRLIQYASLFDHVFHIGRKQYPKKFFMIPGIHTYFSSNYLFPEAKTYKVTMGIEDRITSEEYIYSSLSS